MNAWRGLLLPALAVLALGGSLLGLAACRQATAPPEAPDEAARFRNVEGAVAYVGDDACASCHESQYQGYQTHGMAQSLYALTPENAVEDWGAAPVYHAESDFYYRPYREGARFFQEEYRLGPGGAKTHQLVREVKYVMGSGSAARTYLAEVGGRLYEMPLTWYTQAPKWDMSPGYKAYNERFDRLVPDACMACHNSYPEAVPFAEGKYAAVPLGIGCERCHGPGALHVEARLADPDPPDSVDVTIVNPAHLSLERRLDVCQQCHLKGDVVLLREGRGAYDFRPGQALAAHMALFVEDKPASSDAIAVISHADRMKQSACFLETQGTAQPMDCVTCHDPHEGFRAMGPEYFNATCRSCHAPAALQAQVAAAVAAEHTAGANCYGCHMPRLEAKDAPHSSFTDHWIRVVRQAPTLAQATGPVTLKPYFAETARLPAAPVYEGMAYVVRGRQQADEAALRKGIALLEAALKEQSGFGEAHYLLGFARLQLGQVQAALPALEAAVRLGPDVPERLNTLAQAYEAAGRPPADIAPLYERALQVQPALAEVRVNYGRLLEVQGRLMEALVQYRRAAAEQPWLAAAHYNLGTGLLRTGAPEEAARALQQALTLRPDYPEALGNLGLLYATQNQAERARALFERAVELAPGSATALGNLGSFYLNAGQAARAQDLLERAVAANPAYADGWANLGLAYLQQNRPAEAGQAARRALQLSPSHPLARRLLATLGG